MVIAEEVGGRARLIELIERLGGRAQTTYQTGISSGTLSRYVAQGYVTAADHAVALVEAAGGSVGLVGGLVRPRNPDGRAIPRPRRRPR